MSTLGRFHRNMLILAAVVLASLFSSASDQQKDIPLPQATANALKLSRITTLGSSPFHLRAVIAQEGKKGSEYNAEVEEFWVAPDKWRRTIKSSAFIQTIVVNGDVRFDQSTGDYYPFWLRDLVTAIFDVVPADFSPHDLRLESQDNERKLRMTAGIMAGVDTGFGSVYTGICSRWNDKVGVAPQFNYVFSTVCFEGEDRVIRAVFTPFFHAEFNDYRRYKNQQVPRLIKMTPLKNVHLEARVTQLSEFQDHDDSLFVISPSASSDTWDQSVRVRQQDALARLVNSPDIKWAPVHDGQTTGNFSLMLYIDKQGNVREVWPPSSDNPLVQEQAVREVMQWKFKPMVLNGAPTQMETLLTFHFETSLEAGVAVLSNSEGRKLAIIKSDPHFVHTKYSKGTEFTVRIVVDESGRVVNVENFYKIEPGLFAAADSSVRMWLFRPRVVNRKPERFSADIMFHVD
jgi:TonB-like protein